MDEKTALAYAITKALAYTENGGKPTNPQAGKTGELKSIFQFTPGTWKNYSTQTLGKEVPITPDNETHVVVSKVSKWLEQGYTAKQIASMWNAGEGEPDAYTGKFSNGYSSIGVNHKYGVGYNVPRYADTLSNYAKQFYKSDFQSQIKDSIPAKVSASSPLIRKRNITV